MGRLSTIDNLAWSLSLLSHASRACPPSFRNLTTMGIYDRDYGRYDDQPGVHMRTPQSMVIKLVIFTAILYAVQLFVGTPFTDALKLQANWYYAPWNVYRLLTYGFLHAPNNIFHILMNMFVLWMFGRELEYKYGSQRFLGFYLTGIVFAGLVWSVSEVIYGIPFISALGASGGVAAVVVLFALNFPHRKVFLFPFPFPIPMWVVATVIVLIDASGALTREGNIAFTAHLGGALYGLIFYKTRWSAESWYQKLSSKFDSARKPNLRIHEPTDHQPETDSQVDAILKKIQEQGQDSLTWRERRVLEKASREYQRKKQ